MNHAEKSNKPKLVADPGSLRGNLSGNKSDRSGPGAPTRRRNHCPLGTAEIKSPGDTQFRPAKVKDKLYQQDQCRTLADSRAKLFFTDESILVLSDNTTIDIAKFQMNPQGGRQSALMKILNGSLRFIVTKVSAADKPDFEIEGKTATMGIRGTDRRL